MVDRRQVPFFCCLTEGNACGAKERYERKGHPRSRPHGVQLPSFLEKMCTRCKLGRVASSNNSSCYHIFSAGLGGVEGFFSTNKVCALHLSQRARVTARNPVGQLARCSALVALKQCSRSDPVCFFGAWLRRRGCYSLAWYVLSQRINPFR